MARCFRIGARREQDVKEKITLRSSQQAPLKKLIKNVAANSRLSANILLRKTRLANVKGGSILLGRYVGGRLLCFPSGQFSWLPSIKRQPCDAEELVELANSDSAQSRSNELIAA